jgi:hypothetical protein
MAEGFKPSEKRRLREVAAWIEDEVRKLPEGRKKEDGKLHCGWIWRKVGGK